MHNYWVGKTIFLDGHGKGTIKAIHGNVLTVELEPGKVVFANVVSLANVAE